MKGRLILILFLFVVLTTTVSSQKYFPQSALEYRSTSNPFYWKNKPPYAGYWQQDVSYKITAYIDEKTDIITANEKLTYWNNSPDILTFVYFHLYQNAFTSGSYLDKLSKANGQPYPFGVKQMKGEGIAVESIKAGKVICSKTELDNTILKVYLPVPLKPGESVTFDIDFKTYFDITSSWQRMRVYNVWGNKHYNGAHWYPRIAVYDRRQGWNTDQHLGHEFYGDFGVYDVELNFSSDFIVEATGILSNQDEVLPQDLKNKIDIKNFKDKPLGSKPSVIIPYDSTKRKIWKFKAGNVHDFAFVADPSFRMSEVETNGVKCVAIVSEPYAAGWQDAAELTAKLVDFYSEKIGTYAYPKIVSADAQSGMEYPMLTMLSGVSPGYTYVFAHEIAHNWFYGMVGNNETYHAALDEGFTQFISVEALKKLSEERVIEKSSSSWYIRKFSADLPLTYKWAYYSYLDNALRTNGIQLNTHSDRFNTKQNYGSDYRQVYNKTAVMLYNLQYVLGDDLFDAAMRNYFNQWKLCHPYLEDFRSSVSHFTKSDLSWFFDQWLETNNTIDYAVKRIKRGEGEDNYVIKFKRKGLMQMPVDFTVVSKTDSVFSFYIPDSWFEKACTKNTKVLERWTGWNNLNREYYAKVNIPGGVKNVMIDTTHRLADINMLNNYRRFPARLSFDYFINEIPANDVYQFRGSPAIWWNGYDGLKFGFNLNGSYMDYKHIFDFDYYLNSGWVQSKPDVYENTFNYYSFMFNYETPLSNQIKNLDLKVSLKHIDGFNAGNVMLVKNDKDFRNRFTIKLGTNFRIDSSDLTYLIYPGEWEIGPSEDDILFNTTFSLGYDHFYKKFNYWQSVGLGLTTSALSSDYNYTKINLTALNNFPLGKALLRTRGFVQFTYGDYIPSQSALFVAGANPEEMMDNKYTRATGFFPDEWLGYGPSTGNFHAGGGLNLRGYSGYLTPYLNNDGKIVNAYKGNSGAAVNAELEFDRFVRFKPGFFRDYFTFNTYFFGDAGIINVNKLYEKFEFADFRADAGIGAALTIKKWGPLNRMKPLTLRFDVPFFLSRKPAVDDDYVQFRWVVGVNRAF